MQIITYQRNVARNARPCSGALSFAGSRRVPSRLIARVGASDQRAPARHVRSPSSASPRPVYLPVNQDGAVVFFRLINARHERAPTVLTSNKSFEEWGGVLGDVVMAAALIDRLVHHCHIVNIRGNSYRMTFGTPPPVTPSCRAKTCFWSESCSVTGGTRPRPDMFTSQMIIFWTRLRRLVELSRQQWLRAKIVNP